MRWTSEELRQLRVLAEAFVPPRIIARVLYRTETAVRQKASRAGIPLLIERKRPKHGIRRGNAANKRKS